MKLSITKSEFLRGLGRIQSIVEKRNSMPILANVLIEAPKKGKEERLQLAATDLEVGIRSQHPAEVEKAGGLTVSAKKLFEIVRELSDERIDLESTSNSYLEIRCNRSRFTLAGTAAEEYPTLPEFNPERTVPVSASVLSAMIERTMYAASVDETRYNLNGVYLEVLGETGDIRLVATDGHRLACVDRAIEADASALASGVIVPRKGLGELKRLVDEDDAEEIELAFANNSGLARKGDVTLVMRLIEGEFPNYNQVIPRDLSRHLLLPTDTLTQAVRRVALLSSERNRAVKLELTPGQLVISSNNPDLGDAREELDVDYAGENLTVGFNARYLLDAINAIGEKEVRFSFQDSLSPSRITPAEDEKTLAVVMPMRI
ncbi:MAG: DNA polymerase III subunit beta [Spirochaetaceae bacterium]|nr:DNA polymerase III subunit beta [Myxococcales bacterium]MCB9723948.1 DNA polymerase III subunit beta [Spirochaetaceae bacterium]HPG25369.1 DNA polymerase III subunit beta [Myxococcota bacterium]